MHNTPFFNGGLNSTQTEYSESTYHSLIALPELKSTDVTLHTYTGESIVVLGSLEVDV